MNLNCKYVCVHVYVCAMHQVVQNNKYNITDLLLIFFECACLVEFSEW